MSDELVKALRSNADHYGYEAEDGLVHLLTNAADAIEELQKRVPPVPHGRLIDADALMLKILDYIEEYSDVDEKGWHNLKWCAMKEAEMAINNASTIIPASFENLPKSKDSQKIGEGEE